MSRTLRMTVRRKALLARLQDCIDSGHGMRLNDRFSVRPYFRTGMQALKLYERTKRGKAFVGIYSPLEVLEVVEGTRLGHVAEAEVRG